MGANTTFTVWRLTTTYTSGLKAQVQTLKFQLLSLCHGSDSIIDYMQHAKDLASHLATLNSLISHDDLMKKQPRVLNHFIHLLLELLKLVWQL